jgi:alpha-ketoglutarate-dependent taurine dioxygenase
MLVEPLLEHWGSVITAASSNLVAEIDLHDTVSLFEDRGVVLFRGFQFDPENITQFTDQYTERYARPANRRISDNHSVAREADYWKQYESADIDMPLHSESSFSPAWPEILWFFCSVPPTNAGETTLCDGIAIWDHLSTTTKQFFLQQPLSYKLEIDAPLNFKKRPGRGKQPWIFPKPGVSGYLDWDTGLICLDLLRYAVNESRVTNKLCFSNHLLARLDDETQIKQITMANGETIPDAIIVEIKEVSDGLIYDHKWEKGNLMMIDNVRFMHGRRNFSKDSPRRILIIETERSSFGHGSTTRNQIVSD